MIYLYLKTSPSGYRYLGKFTERKGRPNFTVYDYLGSGKVWKQHIQKHKFTSKDIITEILFKTEDVEEFKEVALRYSNKYRVQENPEFANLVPEDGANPCKYTDWTKRDTPEWRGNISKALKGVKKSKEHIRKREEVKKRNGTNKAWNKGKKGCYSCSKVTRLKMSNSHTEYQLKKFKEKLDPIIKNIILDSRTLFGKQLQTKYNLSYEQLRKAKQVYRFECQSGTGKKHSR